MLKLFRPRRKINNNFIKLKFIIENYKDGYLLFRKKKITLEFSEDLMFDEIIEKVAQDNFVDYETIYENSKSLNYVLPNIYNDLWGRYFNPKNGFVYDEIYNRYDREKLHFRLKQLNDIFKINGSKILIQIGMGYGRGGCVGSLDGIRFYIHNANEKDKHANKPHVHCDYSGESISVDLNTLEVTGKFKNPKKQKIALEKIKKNRTGLLNYYQKVAIEGETIKFEMIG